ncbi:MAG: hypothetical protein HRU29_12040 [Rhizobiales bacterium]|nr:hypothetical protein [Hyphomicrobiales bacterium]NRB15119.1 hypothetical protein [Hyphomicrobiales bacterium]
MKHYAADDLPKGIYLNPNNARSAKVWDKEAVFATIRNNKTDEAPNDPFLTGTKNSTT